MNFYPLDSQIELWKNIWYMLFEWKTLIKIGKYAHFFCQRKINITKLSGWHNILSKETRHFMCEALMHAICTPPIFQNMNTSNITKHFYYYEKAHHMFLRKTNSKFSRLPQPFKLSWRKRITNAFYLVENFNDNSEFVFRETVWWATH